MDSDGNKKIPQDDGPANVVHSNIDPDGNIRLLIFCTLGVVLLVLSPLVYILYRDSQKLADGYFKLAAANGSRLVQSNGCIACHAIDKQVVGPSFKDVFNKYKDLAGSNEKLVKKIKEGGRGNWGNIPMPPNTEIPSSDIKTIVQWIMIGEFDAPSALTEPSNDNVMLAQSGNETGIALMNKNGCMACHQETVKLVGPSLVDIAKKYEGDPEAMAPLTLKVLQGGSGTWGAIPMPPQAQASKEEIETIVTWILTLSSNKSQMVSAHDNISGKEPFLNVDTATRGHALYANNCAVCHMHNGEGKPGLAPSIRNRDFLAIASNEFIKTTIKHGRPGTSMIPHEGYTEQNLNDLVAYLRSLEPRNPIKIDVDEKMVAQGDGVKGRQSFTQYCASCHGSEGEGYSAGGSGTGIGLSGFLHVASDDYIFKTVKNGRIGTAMMPFTGARGLAAISDQEVKDIVVYLRSLQSKKEEE